MRGTRTRKRKRNSSSSSSSSSSTCRKDEDDAQKSRFESNNGMMTSIWGPSTWHLLHTMSFNYPVHPTNCDKQNYRNFILNLKHVLPCGKCRTNFAKNLRDLPLRHAHMKSRHTFSRYVYDLHEVVNRMLSKPSGLSFCDVRERYEHFRAKCSSPAPAPARANKKTCRGKKNRENGETEGVAPPHDGCTEPLGDEGIKTKCVLKILPISARCNHEFNVCASGRSDRKTRHMKKRR